MKKRQLKEESTIIHYGEEERIERPVVPPIYQTSLFTFKDYDDILDVFKGNSERHLYSRMSNPNLNILEKKLAQLSGSESAVTMSSGMAAISSAILSCIKNNGHVITINNLYNPTNNFFNTYLKNKMGIETTFVEGKKVSEFKEAIKENTCLIYLESPSTAIFTLQDIEEIAVIAKEKGIKTIIDNTWATPLYQKPIEMGVDLEVHSLSKYINGHSDVVAGAILGKKELIDEIKKNELPLLGGKLGAFEAWLILRGLRTLPQRLRVHSENTEKVVQFLDDHPKIIKVNHPYSKTYDQIELAEKQMKGYSGLLSFQIDTDLRGIKTFLNSLTLFKIGVSWGGYESLVFAPNIAVATEMTEEQIKKINLPIGVIRVSVGLENIDDLLIDLEEGLKKI